eukprot:gene48504-5312_t
MQAAWEGHPRHVIVPNVNEAGVNEGPTVKKKKAADAVLKP